MLGTPYIRDAILALGTDRGVTWFETALESPVWPQWGELLYRLNPSWEQLERWSKLSKEHCLAVFDALLLFGNGHLFDGKTLPRLPDGADHAKIHALLDDAMARYRNPRMQMNERALRHLWPIGKPVRHTVSIPEPMRQAAEVLFESRPDLMRRWRDEMETALDPPVTPEEIWFSLVIFGDRNELLVFMDWNAAPEDTVGRLRTTHAARHVDVAWEPLERFAGGERRTLGRHRRSTL